MIEKIWIIVANYNNELFLGECLEAIANQTFESFECIIVDDGSKDNSRNIISAICEKDSRFVAIYQENQGVSVARNHGIEMALENGAAYIAFADSDDAYFPNAFQNMVDLASKSADIDCIMTDCIEGDQFTQAKHTTSNSYAVFNNAQEHYGMYSQNLLWYTIWGKLFARRVIENVRFVPNLHPDEDMLFIIETFKHAYKFFVSKTQTYFYRTNPKGVMNDANKKRKHYKNFYTIAEWSNSYFCDGCDYDRVARYTTDYAIAELWDIYTQDARDIFETFIKSKIYTHTELAKKRAEKLKKYRIINALSFGCIPKIKHKFKMAKLISDEMEFLNKDGNVFVIG